MSALYSADSTGHERRLLTPDALLVRDDLVCTFCMAPVRRRSWVAFSIEPFVMVYRESVAEKRITVTCEPSCHPVLSDGLVDPILRSHPYYLNGLVTCTSCRRMIDRGRWAQLDRIAARNAYRVLGRSYASALAWASGEHAMYRLHRIPGPWRTFDELEARR
jgi:hypothetical protein